MDESSTKGAPERPTTVAAPRIADLHCDLLAYLAMADDRTVNDPASRCSAPQLRAGSVGLQTLAIFTLTSDDAPRFADAQAAAFGEITKPADGPLYRVADRVTESDLGLHHDGRTGVVAAIENASGLCAEDASLDQGLRRLAQFEESVGPLLYVSLTWNQTNRFGGGCANDDVGLRDDGRTLLEAMNERGIAIDLSHASARLAAEVLDYREAKGLRLPVCASHSCFRALNDVPRNLPDDVARAIAAADGIIGLNFLRTFLGPETSTQRAFHAQLEHAERLGLGHAYGLGADFFCAEDVPAHLRSGDPNEYFFPDAATAACYPKLLAALGPTWPMDDTRLTAWAHGNVERFVHRVLSQRRNESVR